MRLNNFIQLILTLNFVKGLPTNSNSNITNLEINNITDSTKCQLLLKKSNWIEKEFEISLNCIENGIIPINNEFIEIFSNNLAEFGFNYYEINDKDELKELNFVDEKIIKRFLNHLENLPIDFY